MKNKIKSKLKVMGITTLAVGSVIIIGTVCYFVGKEGAYEQAFEDGIKWTVEFLRDGIQLKEG